MKKDKLDLPKDLLVRLRGPRLFRGTTVEKRNENHIISVELLWCIAWTDIQIGTPPTTALGRLVHLCKTADTGLLLQDCALVCDSMKMDIQNYDEFKAHLRTEGCSYLSLIGLNKSLFELWFQTQDINAWKRLYSWYSFPQRLHLISESLGREAMESFIATQRRLDTLTLTVEEQEIISRWFPLSDEQWLCRHYSPHFTSGSSKVGKDLASKYRDLRCTPRYRFNMNHLVNNGYEAPTWYQLDTGEDDLVARMMFVPKSYKAYRAVTLEPTTLTWIANGWAEAFWSYLKARRTPFSRRYCINTDKVNAALARVGSATQKYATIDLSSASDSVTLTHFRTWFSRSSIYMPGLLSRAKKLELPDGTVIEPNTFMGMGARLCFLIETVAFAAMTEAAIVSVGGKPEKSNYRVYGDDIVVEEEYVEPLLERLTRNGFLPNEKKSFYGDSLHLFRESCGGEYLDGFDVTPPRIPRVNFTHVPSVAEVPPTHLQGLVDLANSVKDCFPMCRRFIIDELRHQGPLPLFGESGLKSPSSTNFDKVVWWNYEFQYPEYEISQLTTIPKRRKTKSGKDVKLKHDHWALAEWLRRSDGRQRLLYPEDRVDVEMVTPDRHAWSRAFVPVGPDQPLYAD